MKHPALAAFLFLAACAPNAPGAEESPAPAATEAPAGRYALDKPHASLLFRVDHLGFSNYTGAFKRFDAKLDFDPENPEAMRVEATIDPTSLDLNAPPEGFLAALLGSDWFDAGAFREMTFTSTAVALAGPERARVTGDFTLHGVTKPLALDVVFNGGYAGYPPYDPQARIGFSAHGTLNRSDFGIAFGIPEEGSTLGVSDEVDFIIEAEFTGPPAPEPPQ